MKNASLGLRRGKGDDRFLSGHQEACFFRPDSALPRSDQHFSAFGSKAEAVRSSTNAVQF